MAGFKYLSAGLLALSSSAVAQLLGCNNVTCPLMPGDNMLANCQLGNVTANDIGIAKVNTTLSPQPLTWTVGLSQSIDPANNTLKDWRRDFYLGQPPSVALQNSTSINGCAVFLNGVASSLKFHDVVASDLPTDNGNCGDALTPACASALSDQALAIANSLADNGLNGTLDCDDLAQKLSANTPVACQSHGDLWTNISARAISGSEAPAPIELTNCYPTIGSNYSVSQIEEVEEAFVADLETLSSMEYVAGITPIFTILVPSTSGNATSLAPKVPEAHLSCLKIMATGMNNQNQQGPVGAAVSNRLSMAFEMAVGSAVATFAWIWWMG